MPTMTVPVFQGEGRLEYVERPLPTPTLPDDVLVRVEACGICGTDLNILATPPLHKARPGIVIGHEGLGSVVEAGPQASGLAPGDRVAIAPRLTCGRCAYCRRGLDNQCTNYQSIGVTREGAFAPYIVAPGRALWKIDPAVPRDDAVFFEPLSCVVGAAVRAPLRPGDNVAVVGGGPMGLLFALLYRALGAAQIFVVDVAPYRLEFAQGLGFTALDAGGGDPAEAVRSHTGLGADIVVDAVGSQIDAAVKLARRGGHILLFGLRPEANPPVHQYAITRHDLTLHGCFVGLHPFAQTVQLLESRCIQPSALISHRVPLDCLAEGVELMRSRSAMKVIVEQSA